MPTRTRFLASLLSVAAAIPAIAAPTDWLQFDFDSRHSGNNPLETTITPANVSTLHLVAGYPVVLGSLVAGANTEDGAPVLLTGVTTPLGVKDVLYLTTKNGRIMAIDAATGTLVWTQRPSTTPNYTTSSPAIDPNGQFVYSYGLEGKVHKYQAGDGVEITTGGWPELATLKPSVEKGSSALSFATDSSGTTYLYCANGGYPGDAGDYQGHVTTINLTDGTQKVFNVSCSDLTIHFVLNGIEGSTDCPLHPQNAVWARPGVVYDPDTDSIYVATSNGDYDGNLTIGDNHDWGDSVMKLTPDGAGSAGRPLDVYTPTNFQHLEDVDADLGSTNAVLLPMPAGSLYPHVAAQCGKDAEIRLINLDDMSGQGGPGHIGGELQLINEPNGQAVLPSPAMWVNPADSSTWMFVASYGGISGLQVTLLAGVPRLTPRWSSAVGSVTSPIVANGIVYYVTSGVVRALAPTTGAVLWSSAEPTFGGIHWESPIVVNGRLYVADENAKLWAFELLACPTPPTAAASGTNTTFCAGQGPAQLTGSGATSCSWTPTTGLSNAASCTPTANPLSTTTYTLTVTDAGGCASTNNPTVTVTVNTIPTAAASGSATICAGGSTGLTGSGGASCSWSPVTGLSNAASCTPVASPLATTTYTLTVTSAAGCVSINNPTVTVTVNPLPTASITAPSGVHAYSIGNTATAADAGVGATYAWTITNGSITAGMGTTTITFDAGSASPITLGLTVTSAQSCQASTSQDVTVSAPGSVLGFYTVAPCRVIDTRRPNGTFGGPPLAGNGATRDFPISSQCGIPADAQAVALNITVVVATAAGDLRLFPTGTPAPSSSAINFNAGRTRANNILLSLIGNPLGSFTVQCDIPGGSTHFLVDVVGYFR